MTEPPIDAEAVRHLIAEAGVARDAADAALVKARRLAAEAGIATDGDGGDDVLTVQRINIVEPDGTLRLAISNRARFPGIVYHGHETPHPDRDDVAGLIFFNDEATEDGGLVWAGAGTGNGYHSGVHLSFDNYEQDQSLVLQSIDESREHRRQVIAFIDRPDWPLADLIALTPEKVDDFLATHEQAVTPDALGARGGRLSRVDAARSARASPHRAARQQRRELVDHLARRGRQHHRTTAAVNNRAMQQLVHQLRADVRVSICDRPSTGAHCVLAASGDGSTDLRVSVAVRSTSEKSAGSGPVVAGRPWPAAGSPRTAAQAAEASHLIR